MKDTKPQRTLYKNEAFEGRNEDDHGALQIKSPRGICLSRKIQISALMSASVLPTPSRTNGTAPQNLKIFFCKTKKKANIMDRTLKRHHRMSHNENSSRNPTASLSTSLLLDSPKKRARSDGEKTF